MSDELERDLEEWLVGGDPDDYVPTAGLGEAEVEPAPATDTEDANRILRGLAALGREQQRIEYLYEWEVAKLTAWRDDRLSGITRQSAWLHRRLEGWARANWDRAETGHTWKLPAGQVHLRKAQPKCVILPDADLAAIEKVVPAAIEHVPKAKAAVLKAVAKPGPVADAPAPDGYVARLVVTEDGEKVPGAMLLVPTRLSFAVTPGK